MRMTEEAHARVPQEAAVSKSSADLFNFIAENVAALTKRNPEVGRERERERAGVAGALTHANFSESRCRDSN